MGDETGLPVVLLTGAPATGKSTLGRLLDGRLRAALLDQDVATKPLVDVVRGLVEVEDLDDRRLAGLTRAPATRCLPTWRSTTSRPVCRSCSLPPTPPCLVTEDASAGITAATRAGCHTLGVLTTYPRLDGDAVPDLSAVAVEPTSRGLDVSYQPLPAG